MALGLRLSLLVLVAGCAGELLVVPDADWDHVPAAQRAAIDRQHDADLAGARAELTAATKSLAELHPVAAAPPAGPPAPRATADRADRADRANPANPANPASAASSASPARAAEPHPQDQATAAALTHVDAAADTWQRADLAWRQSRVDAASARVDMIVASREFMRAKAVDRNLPDSEDYDVAPLRGQFSRAQVRWYRATGRAQDARIAFERAGTALASAKQAYAELVRGPVANAPQSIAEVEQAGRFELPGWTVPAGDVRRHGRRHFLDDTAAAPPQLRRIDVALTVRAARPVPADAAGKAAGKPAVAAAPTASKPAAPVAAAAVAIKSASTPAAPITAPKAAGSATVAAKPSTVAAAPATATSTPAATATTRPATPTAATAAARPATGTTITAAARPATTTATTIDTKPSAAAATRDARPAPVPAAATKPVESASPASATSPR